MKLTKYLCHVLAIKDVLDDGICTLAYFHKIVSQLVKRSKKIVIKKTVMIGKSCYN